VAYFFGPPCILGISSHCSAFERIADHAVFVFSRKICFIIICWVLVDSAAFVLNRKKAFFVAVLFLYHYFWSDSVGMACTGLLHTLCVASYVICRRYRPIVTFCSDDTLMSITTRG